MNDYGNPNVAGAVLFGFVLIIFWTLWIRAGQKTIRCRVRKILPGGILVSYRKERTFFYFAPDVMWRYDPEVFQGIEADLKLDWQWRVRDMEVVVH